MSIKYSNKAVVVTIQWPQTNDPNKLWRSWLEKNIGQKTKDWDWGINSKEYDKVNFYFKKGTAATLFILRFA